MLTRNERDWGSIPRSGTKLLTNCDIGGHGDLGARTVNSEDMLSPWVGCKGCVGDKCNGVSVVYVQLFCLSFETFYILTSTENHIDRFLSDELMVCV